MNDFLMTELARHWMSRVVRDAELARQLQAAETSSPVRQQFRRRRRPVDR